MGNFPLTHIAVNLSLIVAMAIQPVAACMVSVDRSASCSERDNFMCPGCGCCEVEQADDRCGCCAQAPDELGTANDAEQEASEPSCCSHDESANTESSNVSSDEFDTTAAASKRSEPAESESGVRSVCCCMQSSQPLSDSSPRRPVSENRTSLVVGYVGAVGADADEQQLRPPACNATDIRALPHFSQILFCIWRL